MNELKLNSSHLPEVLYCKNSATETDYLIRIEDAELVLTINED